MKIAIFQLNYKIGDIQKNKQLISEALLKAKKEEVELAVFSELAVCGYMPYDLLMQQGFVEECMQAITEIATYCKGIAAIVGAPTLNEKAKGKKFYNSACFLENGKWQKTIHKTLLPDYDVFDEYRYFEPNKKFEILQIKDERIALTICEDLWDIQPQSESKQQLKLYGKSPMQQLKKWQPTMIINIAASPYAQDQQKIRESILQRKAKKYQLPLIYTNQVGANTELIFDGNSLFINDKGEIIKRAKSFETDFLLIDTKKKNISIAFDTINTKERIASIHNALLLGIKDYFSKMNFQKAILGLSGGIDSAVVLTLAERAIGAENIHALLMPSKYSSDHSIFDAEALAKNLKITYDVVPIHQAVSGFEKSLEEIFRNTQPNVAEENIQARIRGTLLMAFSNKFGHILLNTSNKSEAAVGYSTMYGDMNGAISVLGDVYKTDVFHLARFMNKDRKIIPENTITKAPSAELRPNQKDADSLPPYEILDAILFQYIELQKNTQDIVNQGYDEQVVKQIVRLVNLNEYKRFQSPPILRVSSKSFGWGRKMPLVASF